MFAFDTSRGLGMCTVLDKNDTKCTTSCLVYLRFENKDWSVCGKVPSDLLFRRQWGHVGNQDRRWGRGTGRILVVLHVGRSMSHRRNKA
jgi:hypothetical protein